MGRKRGGEEEEEREGSVLQILVAENESFSELEVVLDWGSMGEEREEGDGECGEGEEKGRRGGKTN